MQKKKKSQLLLEISKITETDLIHVTRFPVPSWGTAAQSWHFLASFINIFQVAACLERQSECSSKLTTLTIYPISLTQQCGLASIFSCASHNSLRRCSVQDGYTPVIGHSEDPEKSDVVQSFVFMESKSPAFACQPPGRERMEERARAFFQKNYDLQVAHMASSCISLVKTFT